MLEIVTTLEHFSSGVVTEYLENFYSYIVCRRVSWRGVWMTVIVGCFYWKCVDDDNYWASL